jgi:hypothetical protein
MIRYANEKSNGNFCSTIVESTNDLIRDLGLLELPLIGRNYTWSNMRSPHLGAHRPSAYLAQSRS